MPGGRWLTAAAFALVGLPFVVAVVRLLLQSGSHLTLADDLALIDLHTRRALAWHQQLGVFDRNDWNHPGPTYFYLQAQVYRLLGGGARSLFVGAAFWNGLAALACVAVVRRRSTPARALWAALWICALVGVLAASGPGSTTYSESVLGGLVSPWNPMVVILPLLLTVLLCAAAVDRSACSLLAAAVTGSYVVQTDISAAPLVAVVGGAAALAWLATAAADLVRLGTGEGAAERRAAWWARRRRVVGPLLALGATAVLVVMWLPPLAQQRAGHPGNLTLVARFFAHHHDPYPLSVGWRALLSVDGVLVHGPGGVMRSYLGLQVIHPVGGWVVTVVAGCAAAAAVAGGVVQRNRFAIGLGALVLVGGAAVVVAATHVVGYIFGYILIWAVVLPVAGLIAPGLLAVPAGRRAGGHGTSRPVTAATGLRVGLCVVVAAVSLAASVRVAAMPALARASDPTVGRLTDLVVPFLHPGSRVFVGDSGAGTEDTKLLDTEEFIGLVNLLDERGYRPTVNHVWRTEFGPGYQTTGREPRQVVLTTWDPTSPTQPGYAGKAGDMAVTITDGSGAPVGRAP